MPAAAAANDFGEIQRVTIVWYLVVSLSLNIWSTIVQVEKVTKNLHSIDLHNRTVDTKILLYVNLDNNK